MGFLSTADTVTITTKLTTYGRKELLEKSNTIFSHFMLGDSDANYRTSALLPTGTVPTTSGELNEFGVGHHDNAPNEIIVSNIYVSNGTAIKKVVEPNSSSISSVIVDVGDMTVSGDSLNYLMLHQSGTTVDFTNLFKSLNLAILDNGIPAVPYKNTFTATTWQNGGWSNTAYSGLAANNVLIAVIDNDQYGELIDGKNIMCRLPIATGYTSGGTVTGITTYDIYSTFPFISTLTTNALDNPQWIYSYKDKPQTSLVSNLFGKPVNVSYLVSDNIRRPNNDPTKSWSTGFNTIRPFEINNKSRIREYTSTSTPSLIVDRAIGVAYLDKGILVFTDPEIVNNIVLDFSGDTETGTATNTLGLYHYTGGTYNTFIKSINHNVTQNIICYANRNQFYKSQNETRGLSDPVRISEIAITDIAENILAIGKIDRQRIKAINDVMVFEVKIIV